MESAMAMELPFTFAAAVALGGVLGYYLDKWLHTAPWLLILFGAFGFTAGIVEIARRFRPRGSTNGDGRRSS
jgi:ATP synthase protein I